MRTMSAALTAACGTPGSVFDLRLELADTWPHFATIATPVGVGGGPATAVLAPDGALVAGYVGTLVPNTVYALRVTDPTDPARWSGWVALSANARAQAGRACASRDDGAGAVAGGHNHGDPVCRFGG